MLIVLGVFLWWVIEWNNEQLIYIRVYMPDEILIYDPVGSDSPSLEALAFRRMDINELTIEDLTNPQAVQFLVFQYKVAIDKNRELAKKIEFYEQKLELLDIQRENLRVEIASLKERSNKTWFEIPGAVLIGFGTNLITSGDDKISDIGIALLLIGLVMVLSIRAEQLRDVLVSIRNFFHQEGNRT